MADRQHVGQYRARFAGIDHAVIEDLGAGREHVHLALEVVDDAAFQGVQPGLIDRMSQFDGQIQPLGKVRKGDTVNLDFTPGQGLLVSVNGRALGPAIAGDDFYDALLGIFIGPKPVDDRLKAGLLGTVA